MLQRHLNGDATTNGFADLLRCLEKKTNQPKTQTDRLACIAIVLEYAGIILGFM